jgi:hypothetical protein
MVWPQKDNTYKKDGFLLMKPIAFLVEEFDSTGQLVWSGLMTSKPTSLEISQDIKNKLHNWTITPLIPDTKNIIKVTNVKKYDSKKLIEANNGL